ncbi:DUF2721 domain-containing protein [Cytophagaceae bacterium DM2B3-1]|uniref:DUF2721 domain-containing protein n=1 Tax=Xanthocytophaga flava TaxID=3048013 RepID=A0AAE3U729_9BACT|nr:DUF2721 domain-containing protein [Xanthocytophaga flavus]MDJ1468078.1 DUF2721 domain-containing protein [Xanthocytophaga flavus]MDJ1481172.1 DUF2721 domain-containing protein [Xanthocytophaga flavus]MDJ1495974.1 DUF2721 domain-containing protein [Xanthocytophaga flavus]
MELSVNVPAFIFPTISLLMLAYTNRFMATASLIRNLHALYQDSHDPKLIAQIRNLRQRINLIRNMQVVGVMSLFLSVVSMFLIFNGKMELATYAFGASLVTLMISLSISVAEIYKSTKALNIQLSDMEESLPSEFGIELPDKINFKKKHK